MIYILSIYRKNVNTTAGTAVLLCTYISFALRRSPANVRVGCTQHTDIPKKCKIVLQVLLYCCPHTYISLTLRRSPTFVRPLPLVLVVHSSTRIDIHHVVLLLTAGNTAVVFAVYIARPPSLARRRSWLCTAVPAGTNCCNVPGR